MNKFREELKKREEARDLEIFEKIKNNPKPEISDLWALSPSRFLAWRRMHDLPKLIEMFNSSFKLFKEWKEDSKITDEILLNAESISGFLTRIPSVYKSKTKYLTENLYQERTTTFVTDYEINDSKDRFGEFSVYRTILKFQSYLDWLAERGEKQEILNVVSRTAPGYDMETVEIKGSLSRETKSFELLKMGGAGIQVIAGTILFQGKHLEFVNLCGFRMGGTIYFGEYRSLECTYCVCDNMTAEALTMPNLTFNDCRIENFKIQNSDIAQWRFYNCYVTGDFESSKFRAISVYSGHFSPFFSNCKIQDFEIKTVPPLSDTNLNGYRLLKKMYADQGEEAKAREYFVKENEFIRNGMKLPQYLWKSISYHYWKYGSEPGRIILWSVGLIFLSALVYWFGNDSIILSGDEKYKINFIDALYFSTVTFTTLGYGDILPTGAMRICSSIEAFLGIVNMGCLVAGYSNTKY